MAQAVEHNVKNLLFFVQLADKSKAVLEYKKLPDRIIEMYHTEVPPQHRGKGIAENLVKNAFRYCLDNNYKVYPTCSFVDKYTRNLASEEERKIVVKDLKQPYLNTEVDT